MSFSNENLFDQEQLKSNKIKKQNKIKQKQFLDEEQELRKEEIESIKSEIQNITSAIHRLQHTAENQLFSQVEWYKNHWFVALSTAIATGVILFTLLKLTPLSLFTLSEKDKSLHEIGKLKVQMEMKGKRKKN